MMKKRGLNFAVAGVLLLLPVALRAETGAEAWLRYAPLTDVERSNYAALPGSVVTLGESPVLDSARDELVRGIRGMLGIAVRESGSQVSESSIVLGTVTSLQAIAPGFQSPPEIQGDGFWLTTAKVQGFNCIVITGANEPGVLYGAFAFLRGIALGQLISPLNELQQPYSPVRWVDQWDNLDGHIERGYAGPSIFFEAGTVRADLSRARDYARLLASLGINGCTVNNVNANPRMLEDDFLPQLARIADAFRPWGVRLAISVNLSRPNGIGGLKSFDPLDRGVQEWWRKKIEKI